MMEKNGLRIGKVSSIDYETGMLQVVYRDKGNAVTGKMPYANFNGEYCMPKIGESVLVAHMSNGSSRGVVLSTMWNSRNVPEEGGRGLYRKELSKRKGTAYVRFEDSSGKYLVKAPGIVLHGIDSTELEGPEVSIAANIRTGFESPEHRAVLGEIHIEGMEEGDISVEVASNVMVAMGTAELESIFAKAKLEAEQEIEITAKERMGISAEELRLEDGTFATTLSAVLERLEALDGDMSARK